VQSRRRVSIFIGGVWICLLPKRKRRGDAEHWKIGRLKSNEFSRPVKNPSLEPVDQTDSKELASFSFPADWSGRPSIFLLVAGLRPYKNKLGL
jgi:hypothetical protein